MVRIYYSDGAAAFPTQLLNAFQFFDYATTSTDNYHVSADKPIHVAQFAESLGNTMVNADSDAFMMMLESTNFKSCRYSFSTMDSVAGSFSNTIHITIATSDKTGLLLDNAALSGNTWVDMATTPHSITRIDLNTGVHVLSHSMGKMFSALLYGQRSKESYAVPIQPAPGTYCFTAHARTLQEGLANTTPVAGECFHHYTPLIILMEYLKKVKLFV